MTVYFRSREQGKSVFRSTVSRLDTLEWTWISRIMPAFSGHTLLQKAIFILIACALVFVSSAQHFVVARSLAAAEPTHANHMRAAMAGMSDHSHHKGAHGDEGDNLKKQAQGSTQEPQDSPCCELSCVTIAVIGTTAFAISSSHGQRHFAAVVDNMDGVELFELMRPPRV